MEAVCASVLCKVTAQIANAVDHRGPGIFDRERIAAANDRGQMIANQSRGRGVSVCVADSDDVARSRVDGDESGRIPCVGAVAFRSRRRNRVLPGVHEAEVNVRL